MKKPWSLLLLALVAATLLCARAGAEEKTIEPVYRLDPVLTLESPRQTAITAAPQSPVVIDKGEHAASMRLQTETLLAPYVGAELPPDLSAEERRLLSERQGRDGLDDYKLEAGIGLYVEDRASLNLGYRFQNPPSLLDDRRSDPLTLTGDLRITFDVKVPFD